MDERLKGLISDAENGDVKAMVMVGDCYTKGLYVEKDEHLAHIYYKKAADTGHPTAALMVAIDYLNGIGISEDKKSGVKYLTFSAENGSAYAQNLLATLYRTKKIGAFKAKQKAAKYYEMAAIQGDAKSQIELADLIWNSKNSKYSLDDMLFWLVCAYLHGLNEEAYEESNLALSKLNTLLESGLPGGMERVENIIDIVKRNHPSYLKNPY